MSSAHGDRVAFLVHWPRGTQRMAGVSEKDVRERLARTWSPMDVSSLRIEREPETEHARKLRLRRERINREAYS